MEQHLPDQQSTKRVAILVESAFEDSEFLIPYNALKQAGADVQILGSRGHVSYAGKQGRISINADASTAEVLARSFAAIVIPGGMAPDTMRTNMRTVHLVRDALQQGKLVATICHGPQVLIEGDLVRGKNATGFRAIRKDMQNAGATYIDAPLVEAGNLLTSRRPGDLPIFATALLQRLGLEIEGQKLYDINNVEAPWWQVAEYWGGNSKGQIIEAIEHTLRAEQYAAEMCLQHAQKVADEGLQVIYQELGDEARQHMQLLTRRLHDLGSNLPPANQDGAQEARQDWHNIHDSQAVLLHVLDHLQARIASVYQMGSTLTDPITVAILDHMEVSLAKSEQHLVNTLQQRLLGVTIESSNKQAKQ